VEEEVRERLRAAFAADPRSAFRTFFALQERLKDEGRDADARLLAGDLAELLPALAFAGDGERARFLHDFAVFLGSRGPAADLPLARRLFAEARAVWTARADAADEARALHNEANALQNLAESAEELREALALYERALVFRTEERAIARGVTLHNLGAALRKLAEMEAAPELLGESEEALLAAIAIREAEGLVEGLGASWFQLGLTLDSAARHGRTGAGAAARAAFLAAASAYQSAGKDEEAAVARRCAADA
jgi:hypothetical protein